MDSVCTPYGRDKASTKRERHLGLHPCYCYTAGAVRVTLLCCCCVLVRGFAHASMIQNMPHHCCCTRTSVVTLLSFSQYRETKRGGKVGTVAPGFGVHARVGEITRTTERAGAVCYFSSLLSFSCISGVCDFLRVLRHILQTCNRDFFIYRKLVTESVTYWDPKIKATKKCQLWCFMNRAFSAQQYTGRIMLRPCRPTPCIDYNSCSNH